MRPQQIEPFNEQREWDWIAPEILCTEQARELFERACRYGILRELRDEKGFLEGYTAGAGITKGQLAYFVFQASSWLGVDRGSLTNWKPFETLCNAGNKTPLRAYLHNIDYGKVDYTKPIDDFFKNAL